MQLHPTSWKQKEKGCKNRRQQNRRETQYKSGCKEAEREVGEGAAPKSEIQRASGEGLGDPWRFFRQAEPAAPSGARPPGGEGARRGVSRGEETPARGSAPQQCESAGAERSLYSRQLWGCPPPSHPLPTPQNPASSPPARATSCICKHRAVGPAPCSLFRTRSVPHSHPREWTGSEAGERTPEEHRGWEGSKHMLRWGRGQGVKRRLRPRRYTRQTVKGLEKQPETKRRR